MAPLRRKKGNSQSPPNVPGSPVRTPTQFPRTLPMKTASARTPMKSPLRQVRTGGITKNQKLAIIENLNLEIAERSRKLRAQYTMQARSLKQRIEMRINRVPKKLWGMKIGELLALSVGKTKDSKAVLPKIAAGAAKAFVEDVRRLSYEGSEQPNSQAARLIIPKKRVTKKAVGNSAREKMPPPPLPTNVSVLSPAKPHLPTSSSSPPRSSSPARPAPTKKAEGRARKKAPSSGSLVSASTRPSSRATLRSSMETAVTSAGSSHENTGAKGTKSAQAKTKTIKANTGLKRGGVKDNPSSGSLKENRVAGVREKPAASKSTKKETTTAVGGRVLRSRK